MQFIVLVSITDSAFNNAPFISKFTGRKIAGMATFRAINITVRIKGLKYFLANHVTSAREMPPPPIFMQE